MRKRKQEKIKHDSEDWEKGIEGRTEVKEEERRRKMKKKRKIYQKEE